MSTAPASASPLKPYCPAGHPVSTRPIVFPLYPLFLRCSGRGSDIPPVSPPLQPEEKQKASAAFAQLRAAMGTLGITAEEQAAVWRVLAGIYHLGAAGACKGERAPSLVPCLSAEVRGGSRSLRCSVLGCVARRGGAMLTQRLLHGHGGSELFAAHGGAG